MGTEEISLTFPSNPKNTDHDQSENRPMDLSPGKSSLLEKVKTILLRICELLSEEHSHKQAY